MLERFLSKDFGFFELFDQMADLCVDAGREFQELLAHPQQLEKHSQKLRAMEQHADEVAHHAMGLLHKTFITPLDREDILHLVKRLDDIMDFIEGAAQRLSLYEVGDFPPQMHTLAEINLDSIEHVKQAVNGLRNLKNRDALMKLVVEINRLENDADQAFRTGMAALFHDEKDVKRIIKLKEIFELLETVTDRCEDVSNVIETIVLEYS